MFFVATGLFADVTAADWNAFTLREKQAIFLGYVIGEVSQNGWDQGAASTAAGRTIVLQSLTWPANDVDGFVEVIDDYCGSPVHYQEPLFEAISNAIVRAQQFGHGP